MAKPPEDSLTEKLLPQNVEAEASVLGCILIDAACFGEVARILRPEDFYRAANRDIYAAIDDLWRAQTPADLITLCEELARRGKLDEIGGSSYVGSLANQVPTSANVESYAYIVERKALARRVIHAAGQIAGVAYHEANHADNDTLAVEAQRLLYEALQRRMSYDSVPHDEVIAEFLEEQMDAIEQGLPAGVAFGFAELDAVLAGIKPTELVYLCGRPGSGKSALATAIAERVADGCAARGAGTVEYVTLEMRATQVVGRILAAHAEVDSRVLRANFRRQDGSIDREAWQAVRQSARELSEQRGSHLRFWARPIRPTDLRLHLERAVNERDCRLAVLDYIALMRPDEDGASGRENEYQRISKLSRDLKQLALELNIPILCLVQMSRESERRQNPRPIPADLRDSGQLEQDGDIVLGVYRGATKMARMAEADPRFAEFAEVIVMKARDGEQGITIPLRFEGAYTRFSDWPSQWDYRAYLNYMPSDEPGMSSGGGGGAQ